MRTIDETSELTVLLAEGDGVERLSVRRALEKNAFEVVAEVRDAEEAVEAALRHRPMLCLLELELPGDAITAASEIYSNLPDTRIVVLANTVDEERALEAVRAGADGYLLRDTAPDRLDQALRAIARGEPAVPRTVTAQLLEDIRAKPVDLRPEHSLLNRTLLYVPRFVHHLRRRLKAKMPFGAAWQSTRLRMRDYSAPRIVQ